MQAGLIGPLALYSLIFSSILSSARILVAGAYESLWRTLWYGDLFPSAAGVAAFAAYALAGGRAPIRLHGALVAAYAAAGGVTDNATILYIPAGLALAAGLWLASAAPPGIAAPAAALGASVDIAFRLAAAGAEPWDSPIAPLYSLLLASAGAYRAVRPTEAAPGPGWGLYYWLAVAELGAAYPNAALRLAGATWYTPLEAGAAGLVIAAGYAAGSLLPAKAALPASALGVAALAAPGPLSLAWAPLMAAGSTAALAVRGERTLAGPAYFIFLMVAAVGVYAYPYLGLWPLADRLEAVIAASPAALLAALAGRHGVGGGRGPPVLYLLPLALAGAGAAALALQAAESSTAAKPDGLITVVSYNVRQGFKPDGSLNAADIVGILENIGADIVCMQEVDGGRLTSAYTDLPLLLLVNGWDYEYQPAIEGTYGVAVASKSGVESIKGVLLPSKGEQRAALKVEVSGVVVVNAHLGLDPEERLEQAEALLGLSLEDPPAVVICGDFNEEEGAAMDLLTMYYIIPKPGSYTCCIGEDFKGVIDYVGVLAGSGASMEGYMTVEVDASDHLPVVALIRPP